MSVLTTALTVSSCPALSLSSPPLSTASPVRAPMAAHSSPSGLAELPHDTAGPHYAPTVQSRHPPNNTPGAGSAKGPCRRGSTRLSGLCGLHMRSSTPLGNSHRGAWWGARGGTCILTAEDRGQTEDRRTAPLGLPQRQEPQGAASRGLQAGVTDRESPLERGCEMSEAPVMSSGRVGGGVPISTRRSGSGQHEGGCLISALTSAERGALSCSEGSAQPWGWGPPTQAPGLNSQRATAPTGGDRVLPQLGQRHRHTQLPHSLPNHRLVLGRSLCSGTCRHAGDTPSSPGRRRSRCSHS